MLNISHNKALELLRKTTHLSVTVKSNLLGKCVATGVMKLVKFATSFTVTSSYNQHRQCRQNTACFSELNPIALRTAETLIEFRLF